MKLIVGLGNPGRNYQKTPHNLGFRAVAAVAESLGASDFNAAPHFDSDIAVVRQGREKILLAKPQTMMNASGDAVRKLASFYRIPIGNIWILHDDLDLPPGTLRHSVDSRAAGHRGVQSIIDALGTQGFHRLRIGVGRDDRVPADDFVLRPLTRAVRAATDKVLTDLPIVLRSLLEETDDAQVEKRARHR